jgi:cytochrome c oxidase subunit III
VKRRDAPNGAPRAAELAPQRLVLDVAALPDHAFGHKGLIWWGTIGFMVIEGSMFVMAIITYFFLRTRVGEWPPSASDPDLTFGTLNTVILLASIAPNQIAKRAAEKLDLRRVQFWLPICLAFGFAFVMVRAVEFTTLGVSWDSNAYGSIVWFLMGIHTIHLATDILDTSVLAALVYTRHMDARRMVDVNENAIYWEFVVFSWIPVYLVIYWAPRWL